MLGVEGIGKEGALGGRESAARGSDGGGERIEGGRDDEGERGQGEGLGALDCQDHAARLSDSSNAPQAEPLLRTATRKVAERARGLRAHSASPARPSWPRWERLQAATLPNRPRLQASRRG